MKWTSKDGKQELDLSKIAYWKYVSKEDVCELNAECKRQMEEKKSTGAFYPYFEEQSELQVYFGGNGSIRFSGEEADDIYNKLISQRQIL